MAANVSSPDASPETLPKTAREISTVDLIFPTPVVRWAWPEAGRRRADIIEAVLRRRKSQKGLQRSNRGGWQSEVDLPVWPEPAVQALVRWVVGRVAATSTEWRDGIPTDPLPPVWRANGWANINPRDTWNALHLHSNKNWHWAAVYYLQLEDLQPGSGRSEPDESGPNRLGPGKGGALVFRDAGTGLEPASNADVPSDFTRRSHRVAPNEGELVVFPSWLYHLVEPHEAGNDRISIAFNLYNAGLEWSRFWHSKPLLWRHASPLMRIWAKMRGEWDQSGPGPAPPPGFDIRLD